MAWVPIHQSGVAHVFEGGNPGLSFADSLVTFEDIAEDPYASWSIEFAGATEEVQARITCLSYSAASGNSGNLYHPSKFEFWDDSNGDPDVVVGNGAPPFPASSMPNNNPVAAFLPSPIEHTFQPINNPGFWYGPTEVTSDNLPVDESFQFLVEVWVEGTSLVANDDTATTPAGQPVNVPVLANDTLDGEPVTLGDLAGLPTIQSGPSNGTVQVQPDGSITYTPAPGFVGVDSFVYEILEQIGIVFTSPDGNGGGAGMFSLQFFGNLGAEETYDCCNEDTQSLLLNASTVRATGFSPSDGNPSCGDPIPDEYEAISLAFSLVNNGGDEFWRYNFSNEEDIPLQGWHYIRILVDEETEIHGLMYRGDGV